MGRPKKQASGQDAKSILIKTFIKLCYWRGTGGITLQELARECGVAFNTVHYHFGGKALPLADAAWEWIEDDRKQFIEDAVNAHLKKGEKNVLKAYLKSQFAWCDQRKENASFWLFRLFQSSTHLSKRSAHGAGKSAKEAKEISGAEPLTLRRLCQEAVGADVYSPLQELPALSRKIQIIVTGSLVDRLTQSAVSQEENFENCWELVTNAVLSHRKTGRR